jgi:hypothetical protein
MRLLVFFLALNVALFAAAADAPGPQSPAGKPAADDNSQQRLRFELEQVYRSVRESLVERNYQKFLNLVLPAREGPPPPEAAFDKVVLNLLDDYPVLEQLTFVQVVRSGDWAGYYTVNNVADPNNVFIHGYKFKHTAEGWKMSGRVAGVMVPRVKGEYRVLDEIALNPAFRLPGQKGYKE